MHIWSSFNPFQHHLGLTGNHSQSASCHIATRYGLLQRQNRIKSIQKKILNLQEKKGFKPLKGADLKNFKDFLSIYANEIVENWNDYDLIFPIWDLYNGRIE